MAYFSGSDNQVVFGQHIFKDLKLIDMRLNKRRIGPEDDDSSPEVTEGQQIYEIDVNEGKEVIDAVATFSHPVFVGRNAKPARRRFGRVHRAYDRSVWSAVFSWHGLV